MGKKLDPNATEKVCTKCKEIRPMDQYHLNKKSADGHQSRCKTCCSDTVMYTPEQQQKNRESRQGLKKCCQCKEIKTLAEFYSLKTSWDGLQGRCSECAKEATRQSYKKNPERAKRVSRQWYANNKEKHYESTLQYKRDHPEKHRESARKSYHKRIEQERLQLDNNV